MKAYAWLYMHKLWEDFFSDNYSWNWSSLKGIYIISCYFISRMLCFYIVNLEKCQNFVSKDFFIHFMETYMFFLKVSILWNKPQRCLTILISFLVLNLILFFDRKKKTIMILIPLNCFKEKIMVTLQRQTTDLHFAGGRIEVMFHVLLMLLCRLYIH